MLHFEINILNILNIFTEIIGMAPSINVQDWYGDRHTCQIASGALVGHAVTITEDEDEINRVVSASGAIRVCIL